MRLNSRADARLVWPGHIYELPEGTVLSCIRLREAEALVGCRSEANCNFVLSQL